MSQPTHGVVTVEIVYPDSVSTPALPEGAEQEMLASIADLVEVVVWQ